MRKGLLVAAITAAVISGSATASSFVQTVSGTQRTPGPITLFDPALGTLNSVLIEGVDGLNFGLVRGGLTDTLPAVSLPDSTTEYLSLNDQFEFARNTITGSETYAEGSIFGSMALSGTLFSFLVGPEASGFVATGMGAPPRVTPVADLITPQVGSRFFSPGDVFTYSIQVTYDYTPLSAVPEASTWAMMLLGFGGIGFQIRRRQSGGPRETSMLKRLWAT